MKITKESLILTQQISNDLDDNTFHHHYHILYDLANTLNPENKIIYLEIGCYGGASSCLMLQRPNSEIITIDLGYPIQKDLAISSMVRWNKFLNPFYYIEGGSHDPNVKIELEKILDGREVDILFIDGDHFYQGVISDFIMYSPLVKAGGYIVFDDYNDREFSPEVKLAVNDLDLTEYEVLGCFGSEFGARPIGLESNEFVIRKR